MISLVENGEKEVANYQGTEMRLRISACIVCRNIKYKALLEFMNQY